MILSGIILFIFFISLGSILLIFGEKKPVIIMLGRIFIIIGFISFLIILIFFLRNFK